MNVLDLLPIVLLDRAAAADLDAWLRLSGRLHPMLVHFPLAFVVLAGLLEFAHLCRRGEGVAPSVRLLLVLATLGAAAAGASGWMNATYEWADLDAGWREAGRPDGPTAADAAHLELHRFASIGVTAGLLLVTVGALATGAAGAGGVRTVTRLGLAVVVGGAMWTGHMGGELVHGRGYVLAALPPVPPAAGEPDAEGEAGAPAVESESEAVPPAAPIAAVDRERLALDVRVADILATHCRDCHGPDQQKAGLQLLPLDQAFVWEPEFWTIVPGDPAASSVVDRIERPEGDRRRMPPDGPGLSEAELALLREWIAGGALLDGRSPAGG